MNERTTIQGTPPFDGSAPCVACPIEVRDLAATAQNFLVRLDAYRQGNDVNLADAEHAFRRSVERMRAISEAHFADRAHGLGDLRP
jgi:hypothetical protein